MPCAEIAGVFVPGLKTGVSTLHVNLDNNTGIKLLYTAMCDTYVVLSNILMLSSDTE